MDYAALIVAASTLLTVLLKGVVDIIVAIRTTRRLDVTDKKLDVAQEKLDTVHEHLTAQDEAMADQSKIMKRIDRKTEEESK